MLPEDGSLWTLVVFNGLDDPAPSHNIIRAMVLDVTLKGL